jgi:hypothetical protein
MLTGMSLDDAADLLGDVSVPGDALGAGCHVLSGLLAQFRVRIGSRPLEWWQRTFVESNAHQLADHERDSLLILAASAAGGIAFGFPARVRDGAESRRLVAGLLQMSTVVAVMLRQAGCERDEIIAECAIWSSRH